MSEVLTFNGVNIDGTYVTQASLDDIQNIAVKEYSGSKAKEKQLAEKATELNRKQTFLQQLKASGSSNPEIEARVQELLEDSDLQEYLNRKALEKSLTDKSNKAEEHMVVDVKDPNDLSLTGWGVIFPIDADPRIRAALRPLLELRREQATQRQEHLYQEYFQYDQKTKKRGYVFPETKVQFLQANGADAYGIVNPDKMPYYLLIVGSPQEIPFEFQYQLDVQYAVGRIDFGDDLEAYARYAQSVVYAETGKIVLPRNVSFFGVRTEGDAATMLSADNLVKPLAQEKGLLLSEIEKEQANLLLDAERERKDGNEGNARKNEQLANAHKFWTFNRFLGEKQATVNTLGHLMGGNGGKQTPALLFTASHGMAFPKGHERQFSDQGALLCQDWPGPRSGAIKRDYYFAAENIGDDARLSGMIAFFFACYGGGTPQYDEFARQNDLAQDIADHPFVANLPRRMLTHPNGGALAVLGHIERAWGYSFMENNEKQLNTFKSALVRLMLSEYRVGAVTEFFNGRYAEISSTLTHHLYQFTKIGAGESGQLVPGLWINNNDARGYALFGDPAVRLPIARAEPAEHTVPPPMIDVGAVAEAAKQAGEAKAKTGAESAPPPPPPGATPETPPEESFGLFGGDKEGEGVNIGEALKDVIQKMADTLKDVVDDMTTLQVNTYVSDNMQAVTKDIESDTVSGTLHLRARSSIKLDGDTETILPSTDGEIDTAVWEIHKEIVNQAQQNRNQLVGILVSFLNPKR